MPVLRRKILADSRLLYRDGTLKIPDSEHRAIAEFRIKYTGHLQPLHVREVGKLERVFK